MNVLWVVNTIFPEAAKRIGIPPPIFGGWMYSLAEDLKLSVHLKLGVVTVYDGAFLQTFNEEGIQYFLIPKVATDGTTILSTWAEVVGKFRPDLVHVHGTEYGHGIVLMKNFPRLRYVVSIQGLVSICHRYYLAGISIAEVLKNITLRDLLRRDTLFQAKEKFYKRGLTEIEYIQRADIVLGRTEWDRAHVRALRSDVSYEFCNETLREVFYSKKTWDINRAKRYSIFLSQASYPIKGLHQVLKAVALLKSEFPQIQVFVAGSDITKTLTWSERIRIGGYGLYIKKMVRNLGLKNHLHFYGQLDAKKMAEAYLQANVFVCPSSIENSPNSLGEAQILGVPSIATYCGGIPSMVKEGETALLYRFEEVEMLAMYLRNIFTDDELACRLSKAGKKEAEARHDKKKNMCRLLDCYKLANATNNAGLA